VDWVRPELLVQSPLWITNNQQNIVIHFHQDFVAGMHSYFFKVQVDRGLFYWPNHSRETPLSYQKEEEEEPKYALQNILTLPFLLLHFLPKACINTF
jgi:hypothetical protein